MYLFDEIGKIAKAVFKASINQTVIYSHVIMNQQVSETTKALELFCKPPTKNFIVPQNFNYILIVIGNAEPIFDNDMPTDVKDALRSNLQIAVSKVTRHIIFLVQKLFLSEFCEFLQFGKRKL